MSTILGGVHYSYLFDLMLEVKKDGEEFPVYKPGGCCGNDFITRKLQNCPEFLRKSAPHDLIWCRSFHSIIHIQLTLKSSN